MEFEITGSGDRGLRGGLLIRAPFTVVAANAVIEQLAKEFSRRTGWGAPALNSMFTVDGMDAELEAKRLASEIEADDRILARAEQIKARRAATAPTGFG
jgi:hypothetical protein